MSKDPADPIDALIDDAIDRMRASAAAPYTSTAGSSPKRRKRGASRPTLARIAKQAAKAGVEVARYDFAPDGTIRIVPGKPVYVTDCGDEPNEWDTVQ